MYTIANSLFKVTDRCYIRDIHPTTGGYQTTKTYNEFIIDCISLSMHSQVVN